MQSDSPLSDEHNTKFAPSPDLTYPASKLRDDINHTLHFLTALIASLSMAHGFWASLSEEEQVTWTNKAIFDDQATAERLAFFGQAIEQNYEPLLFEFVISRYADSYIGYLIELLSLIFRKRPDVLKSSERKADWEFILQFQTMDELRAALAEDKLNSLAFRGLNGLHEYFKKGLDLALFTDSTEAETLSDLVEIRNVIVHNKRKVSKEMKKRRPNFPQSVGELIPVTLEQVLNYGETVRANAVALDKRSVAKFGLPVGEHNGNMVHVEAGEEL